MKLKARKIYLELFEGQEDLLDILCEWRNTNSFRNLCSTRRNQVDKKEFLDELRSDFKNDRCIQFVIFENDSRIALGTVYAYGLNQTDGHVFGTIYLDDKRTNKGYGIEAFRLFGQHIFELYGLHKLYAEVYAYNQHSLYLLKKAGFVEEGCFKEHRLMNGVRHDLIRLSFFRTQLDEV